MRQKGKLRGRGWIVVAAVVAAALSLALAGARAATIQTDLWAYQVGDTVTVTGEGFGAGEAVGFVAYDPFGAVADLGQATADDQGNVEYQFVLQSDVPGIYTEVATGQTTGVTASTAFDPTPAKPGTLSFGDARWAGDGVTLSWSQAASGTTADCFYVYRTQSTSLTAVPANPSVTSVGNNPSCSVVPTGVYAIASGPTFTDTGADQSHNYRYGVTGVKASTSGNGGQGPLSNLVTVGMLNSTVPSAFPLTSVGSTAGTQTVTVTNNSGATFTYHSIETSSEFPVSNVKRSDNAAMVGDSTSVANGQTFSFTVAFQPSAGGTRTATLKIEGYDANQSSTTFDTHSITLTGTGNSTPTCSAVPKTTNEDTATSVALSCTDADAGDTLTYSYAQPSRGTVSGTGPNVTYTPAANYNGPDSFTYTATDNHGAVSASATVTLTVSPVNDAPTATNGSATTNEDTAKSIDLKPLVSDVETAPANMTYTIVAAPTKGTLTQTSTGAYTYTPNPNANGSDSFTYKVTDTGDGASAPLTSNTATFSLTINPVNDAPTAANGSATTNEDTAKSIDLTALASDVETAPANMTYAIVTAPAKGTLTQTSTGVYTYTPNPNVNGSDSFTYTVTDTGDGASPASTSSTATVSLTINPVNDAPTASDGSATTNEDTAKAIDATSLVSDIETLPANMTYAVVGGASHGAVTVSGGVFTYTPALNYHGSDSFTYRVTDTGDGASPPLSSSTATISITVVAVNDPPVAGNGSAATNEDTAKSIDLSTIASDVETASTDLTYTIVSGPGHGTLAGGAHGAFTYTPTANYNGPDSFTYTVTDNGDGASPPLTSSAGTFTLTVNPVNDAPVATGGAALDTEDGSTVVDLRPLVSDVETSAGAMTYAIVDQPAHGTLTPLAQNGTFRFTGDPNWNGTDSFTYTATDTGDGASAPLTSATAYFAITAIPVNDAPVATDGAVSATEDTPATVDLGSFASDLETPDAHLIYTIVAAPAHGSLSGEVGGVFTYTPAPNFNGSDSLTYNVTDTGDPDGCTTASAVCDPTVLTSATKTITLTVAPVNDAPSASDSSVTLAEDGSASVDLTPLVSDVETPAAGLTFTIDAGPAHGSLASTAAGVYTYTPAANYNGSDSFTYHVTDTGDGASPPLPSATRTVSIAVTPVNDAPTATDGSASTDEDTATTIDLTQLAHDVETPASALTYTIVSGPAHGSLSGATGVFSFTPAANYNGPDSFTYTVTDSGDGPSAPLSSAVHTVSLTVNPVNDAPTAGAGSIATNEDTAGTIDLKSLTSDVETPAAGLTYAVVSGPAHGGVSLANGIATYTPGANSSGTDSFTYRVTDTGDGASAALSADATVSITVAPVNDAPSLGPPADVSFNEGGSATVDLGAAWSDVETAAAAATFSVVSAPAGLNATVSGTTLTLSAPDNLSGDVTVRGTDGGDGASAPLSAQTTFHVTVNNVAPTASLTGVTPIQEFNAGSGSPQVDGRITFSPGNLGNGNFHVALTHAVPAGKTLVVAVGITSPDDAQQVTSMTDSQGNSYSYVNGFAPGTVAPLGSHSYALSVLTTYVSQPLSAGDVISGVANTTTFSAYDVEVWQLSGIAANGVEASSANDPHQNPVGTVDTLPVTTTDSPTLLFAEHFSQNQATFTATGGYSSDGQSDDPAWNKSMFGMWRVASSSGTFTASAITVPPMTTLNVFVAFRAAAGSAAGPGVSTVSFQNVIDASSTDSSSLRYAFDCNGGDLSSATYATAGTSPSADCAFDNAGDYVVTGRVLDKDGGVSQLYSFTVHVADVAPTATLSNSGPIDEGGSATISFAQQLDGSADTAAGLHYAYACDGGSLATATYANSGTSASTSCAFDDGPASPTVRARIIDQHDGYTEYTTTVAVRNVAPIATLDVPDHVFLGNSFTIGLTGATDPSTADTNAGFTAAFDCGGGFGTVATCTPTATGDVTVGASIADKDGGTSTYAQVVHVIVPAPTATLNVPASVDEGSSIHVSLDGAHSDSPTAQAAGFTYAFDCGDGNGYGPAGPSNSIDCPAPDNVLLTIRGTVFDSFGNRTEYLQSANVANVRPSVTAPPDQAASEGSATMIALGSFTDPGASDAPWHVSVDFGDNTGTAFDAAATGGLGLLTHTYADSGAYTVGVIVTDKDGESGTATFTVTVANVAPTATFSNDGPVAEGSPVHLSFSNEFDPSTVDAAGLVETYACNGTDFTTDPTCTFDDNGTYHVVGRIADKDGGQTDYTTDVTVTNVAPVATFDATANIDEGSAATLSFTNPFDPSSADTTAGFSYAYACDGLHFGAVVDSATTTCAFPIPGTYSVAGRILDKDGALTPYEAQVVVRNVAPALTAPAAQGSDEGSMHPFDLGSFTDPGVNDGPWTVDVSWGDGQSSSFQAAAPGALTRSHAYDDNGSYTATATVTDSLGASDTASFDVTVANVAPTATFAATSPIAEGSMTTLSLTSAFDPSTADTATLAETYSCDGVTFTTTPTCSFADNGTYTVYGRIADKDAGVTTYHADVLVNDVAPTLTAGAPQSGFEGADVLWSLGSFADPGAGDAPWTVAVSWGDGTSTSFSAAAQGAIAADHAYADNGSYTVSATVTDKDGASSAAQSFTVSIGNVPPTVTAPTDQLATEGTSQVFALGSFIDPGSSDGPWAVSVDWGDGTAATTFSPTTTGLLASAAHTYADNGTYTATVSVTDKDQTTGTATFHVAVANAAPVVTTAAAQSAVEGSPALLPLGSFTDLGVNDHPWSVHVTWGDGTGLTFSTSVTGNLGVQTHTYADNGSYTVTTTVTDKDGASGAASYAVSVTNVAPSAALAQVGAAYEGGSATVAFSGQSDPSSVDQAAGFTYRYDCGSGYGAWSSSASVACPFPNSGTYTVHGQIRDKDLSAGSYDATVTVQNVPPTATIANNGPINEGGSAHITLSNVADVSPVDQAAGFTYAFSCHGGPLVASPTPATDCSFDDNGSYPVVGRVTDQDGGSTDYTTTVVVNNVAPTATFGNNGPVVEGSPVTLSLTAAFDPSGADTSAGFTRAYSCDNGSTWSGSATCTFADNGTYAVKGRISDKNGGTTTYSGSVSVTNATPALAVAANQSADEGTAKTFALGTFADAGVVDNPWTVDVNWGDGTTSSFTTGMQGAISAAHTYADNGSYTVSTTVTDKDAAKSVAQTFTVAVANVAPSIAAAATQSSNEGSAVAFDLGSFADPGANDAPWSVDVNWGDGTAHTTFTTGTRGALGTQAHAYDDNGAYTVTVSVTDKDGGSSSRTFTANVANVAPTASFGNNGPVAEGSPVTLSLSGATDPSHADTTAGFTRQYSCDNGTTWSSSPSCTFADNGAYAVKGRISDKDGGTSTYDGTVTVTNVTPAITSPGGQTANEGTATAITLGSFADPGPDSPWSVDVNWGDGSAHFTATAATTGSLGSQSHSYADNGTYTVTVSVTDKDHATGTQTFAVTVANVPPTATFPLTASGTVGSAISLAFTAATDPSGPDTAAGFHYAYDCNNAVLSTITYATATAPASFTCTYGATGTYTVRARIYDKDGGFTEYQSTVTVTSPPPTAAISSGTASINEGTAAGTQYTYTGTITNGDATTTVAADCGTGNAIVSGSLTYTTDTSGKRNGFTYKCVFVYTTPTTYTLHATATRGSTTGPTATYTVAIANVAPTLTISTPVNGSVATRGSLVSLVSSFTDPGGANDGSYTCVIDWGDGSAKTTITVAAPGSCNASHIYSATSNHITETVTDKWGATVSVTRNITVV